MEKQNGKKIIIIDEHVQVWRRTRYYVDENITNEEMQKQFDLCDLEGIEVLRGELIDSELVMDTEMSTDSFEVFLNDSQQTKVYSNIF
jgi:hypothetical protein